MLFVLGHLPRYVDKCLPYAAYHVVPHLFTVEEVRELNKSRPARNQLELLPTGLLKYHCACAGPCLEHMPPAPPLPPPPSAACRWR